jgi:hypothetical protein
MSGSVCHRDEQADTLSVSIAQVAIGLSNLALLTIRATPAVSISTPMASPNLPDINTIIMFTVHIVNIDNGTVDVACNDHSFNSSEQSSLGTASTTSLARLRNQYDYMK